MNVEINDELSELPLPLTGANARFEVDTELIGHIIVLEVDSHTAKAYIDINFKTHVQILRTLSQISLSGYTLEVTYLSIDKLSALVTNHQTTKTDTSSVQMFAVDLFDAAAKVHASDIHLICQVNLNCQVLFRIHGDLHAQSAWEMTFDEGIRLVRTIYNTMSSEGTQNFRIDDKLDARISERRFLPDSLESIRVSAIGTSQLGHSCVLRLLYNSTSEHISFRSLGYSTEHIALLDQISRKPYGCCLISGPTGSGKSTTLKALLDTIIEKFSQTKNVITVEDPCEYPIVGARQTSVTNVRGKDQRKDAYSQAIVAALRHDPDVIMIGEIRDDASAELAVTAAKTGHLLVASVHANNALSVCSRLKALCVRDEDVYDPSLIVAMIAQRLVKQICPKCSVPLSIVMKKRSAHIQAHFKHIFSSYKGIRVAGGGCQYCKNNEGVIGRTLVCEIILPDEKLMQMIRTEKRDDAMLYWQSELGGLSMNDHALQKIRQGIIDPFHAEQHLGVLFPAFNRGTP